MKTRLARNPRPSGLSLLEMMVATAMMATLMASVVVVVRSGHSVWSAQQDDLDVLENAYGVLRHFVRQMRQADSVSVISAPSDMSGGLTFLTAAAATRSWSHDNALSEVDFHNGTSNQLLARGIDQLSFTGYRADGATQTATVEDIQIVECRVRVTLPRGAGTPHIVSARAWIRSW